MLLPMAEDSNRHYLPEWLLRKFRRPTLFELDIHSGGISQRNPKKAASAPDLWPDDIEDKLSVHDSLAARIYRERIYGQRSIVLSDSERWDFAQWLTQFFVRVPTAIERAHQYLAAQGGVNDVAQKMTLQKRTEILQIIRDQNPATYDNAVSELGKKDVEDHFIEQVAKRFADTKYLPDANTIRQHYMRHHRSDRFAQCLIEYEWVWLTSKVGFVIGDNPLVCWHMKTQRWNYGIGRKGVEITMPLGRNLCLRLQRVHPPRGGYLIPCDERTTRQYNCRQRLAAIKHVYGSSESLLDFVSKPIIGWSPS